MDKKFQLAPVATAFAVTLAATPLANAADNPFAAVEYQGGYMVAAEEGEAKCGANMSEGKCGGAASEAKTDATTADTAKGGEGKCGAGAGEGKAGEGKCGS